MLWGKRGGRGPTRQLLSAAAIEEVTQSAMLPRKAYCVCGRLISFAQIQRHVAVCPKWKYAVGKINTLRKVR